MGSYLRTTWRFHLVAALLGALIGRVLVFAFAANAAVIPDLVIRYLPEFIIGLLIIVVLSTPAVVGYIRRLAATLTLPRPWLTPSTLVIVFATCCGVMIATSLLSEHLVGFAIAHPLRVGLLSTVALGLIGFTVVWLLCCVILAYRSNSTTVSQRLLLAGGADDPICSDEQDELDCLAFVERIAAEVRTPRPATSDVVGIVGPWGSGKTSVLCLLHSRLAPEHILYFFNPWYFSSPAAVADAFYRGLRAELSRRFLVGGLSDVIERYAHVANHPMDRLGLLQLFRSHQTVQQLRHQLERWLQDNAPRIVIFIDDVDRLDRPELLTALRVIRLSGRLPSTLFIVAYDEEAVVRTLGSERELLAKIVPKPIRLPNSDNAIARVYLHLPYPPDPSVPASQLLQVLREGGISEDELIQLGSEMSLLQHEVFGKLIRTVRHAKRFVWAVRTAVQPLIGEVNVVDCLLMELLRLHVPDVFRDVERHSWVYLPRYRMQEHVAAGLALDDESMYERVRLHVHGVLKALDRDRDVAQTALEHVFSDQIKNAFRDSHARLREHHKSFRVGRRLQHPDCFIKYMAHVGTVRQVTDREVRELISAINAADEKDVGRRVSECLGRYHRRELVPLLLKTTSVYGHELAQQRVSAVVAGVVRFAGSLRENDDAAVAAFDAGVDLVWFLIAEVADEAERIRILECICRDASLHFASITLFRFAQQVAAREDPRWSGLDLTSARDSLRRRCADELSVGQSNVLHGRCKRSVNPGTGPRPRFASMCAQGGAHALEVDHNRSGPGPREPLLA